MAKWGQTLGRLWNLSGTFVIQDVLTTSMASAGNACEFMGAGTPVADVTAMRPAEVWMVGVQDAAIGNTATVLARLAEKWKALPSAAPVAFHCSGALSSDALAPLADLDWRCASAHCILSFTSAATAVTQFSGTACALEGGTAARNVLQTAFERIQARCFTVESEQKLLYHAAAVFATNFLPVLQVLAESAWRSSGVPEALLPGLRSSLLNNAVANILRTGPEGALTGPATRGDTAAIARQSAAVTAWDAQAGAAYDALSALALRMAKASKEAVAAAATTR